MKLVRAFKVWRARRRALREANERVLADAYRAMDEARRRSSYRLAYDVRGSQPETCAVRWYVWDSRLNAWAAVAPSPRPTDANERESNAPAQREGVQE